MLLQGRSFDRHRCIGTCDASSTSPGLRSDLCNALREGRMERLRTMCATAKWNPMH